MRLLPALWAARLPPACVHRVLTAPLPCSGFAPLPPAVGQPSVAGGVSQATIAFVPPSGQDLYYEAAVLTGSGGATSLEPLVSCHAGVAPPSCIELCNDDVGRSVMSVPLSALGGPGRFAFKLRAHSADGAAGDWSPASAPATVGPPATVSGLLATGSAGGATLTFAPEVRADGGYLIEVLDENDHVVGTTTVGSRQLLEQSCDAAQVGWDGCWAAIAAMRASHLQKRISLAPLSFALCPMQCNPPCPYAWQSCLQGACTCNPSKGQRCACWLALVAIGSCSPASHIAASCRLLQV